MTSISRDSFEFPHGAEGLLDALPDPTVVIGADGVVLRANVAATRLMGTPLDASIGTSALELVHPDDVHLAALSLVSVLGKEVGTPIELRVASSTGWRLVEIVGAPAGGDSVILTMRDLTQRRRWEVAGDDTARFRALVHNAPVLTMLVDPNGLVHSVSGAVTRQLGCDPEDVCGRPVIELVDGPDRGVMEDAVSRAVVATGEAHGPITVEVSLRRRDSSPIPFEMSIVSLLDDPTVAGLLVSGHDISRLRRVQEALAHLANYDALTGLPNRRAFDAAIEREWLLTSRDGIDSFLVVADLDRFKDLNDTLGHPAGDEALRMFSKILLTATRETDVVARLGGDEFAVVLVRCAGAAAAVGFESRVRELISQTTWPGRRPLEVSIGYHSIRRAASPQMAYQEADRAMLDTKADSRRRQA